jgi:hypothetical protein
VAPYLILVLGYLAWSVLLLPVYRRWDEDGAGAAPLGFGAGLMLVGPLALFLLLDGEWSAGECLILGIGAAAGNAVILIARTAHRAPASLAVPTSVVVRRDALGIAVFRIGPSLALQPSRVQELLRGLASAARTRPVVLDIRGLRHVPVGTLLAIVAEAEEVAEQHGRRLAVLGGDRVLRLCLRLMPEIQTPSFVGSRLLQVVRRVEEPGSLGLVSPGA